MNPNLQRLVDAGILKNPHAMTQAFKDQIDSLTVQEVDALISIRAKINPKDLDENADNLSAPV